jgi:hypothetical protein
MNVYKSKVGRVAREASLQEINLKPCLNQQENLATGIEIVLNAK